MAKTERSSLRHRLPAMGFTVAAVAWYVSAIVAANWLVTRYGQRALPYTAFFLIPFDLVVRDLMQDRWQELARWAIALRMGLLIGGGAAISLLTATGSFRINLASMCAFVVAATIDAATYQTMIKYGRIFRINAATGLGAFTDSAIFAALAFDDVSWQLVALQMVTKIAGGFVWSLVLFRLFRKRQQTEGGQPAIEPWEPVEIEIVPMPASGQQPYAASTLAWCNECGRRSVSTLPALNEQFCFLCRAKVVRDVHD